MVTTPLSVLGTRLVCEFTGDNGSYVSGVLNDQIGDGYVASGNYPSTTEAPVLATTLSGNACFNFTSANQVLTSAFGSNTVITPLAALPAPSTGQRLFYFIIKIAENPGSTIPIFVTPDETVFISSSSQKLIFDSNVGTYGSCTSDANVGNNAWHRIIIICDETSSTTSMYVDGTLNSTYLAKLWGETTEWGGYGVRFGFIGESAVGSYLGRMGFAYTTSAFSGTDITNLDAALNSFLQFQTVSTTKKGPTLTLPDWIFDEETLELWDPRENLFELNNISAGPSTSNSTDPFGMFGFWGI